MTVGPDILLGDLTHDLVLVGGDLSIQTDIAQHAKIRLAFFEGEWFLDSTAGVPYFQSILKKGANLGEIQTVYREEILGTPGITALTTLELDFDATTRVLTVEWGAESVQGTIGNLQEIQL